MFNLKSFLIFTCDSTYVTGLTTLRYLKVPVYLMIIFLATHFDVFAQPLLQWDKRFNGPVGSDRGNSITVDSSGNVYVTGRSIGVNTNYDYLTIKYNPDGDTLWTRRYNGTANKSDEPVTIKVDNQGYVYVTGKTERVNGSFDIATIKYDSLGSLKWIALYNGTITTGDDLAYNVEVDEFSNVYIVGSSFDHYGSSNYTRGIVIQYNHLGIQQWKANYGDLVNKALIYDLDKLLIIGNSGIVYDIYELDANNGSQLLDYPGGTLFESFGTGNDMTLDDAGNIYVVSTKKDVFYAYVYTTKFTRGNTDNPIFTWWRYPIDNVSAYTGISVKLDKNKNVYTLASVTSSINYCTISKRNSSMQSVWIKPYFLDSSIDLYPVSFSLRRKSTNPDIYVSGYTSLGDIITSKFDNNDESVPNLIWEIPYDCGTEGSDVASLMVQDQYDNIFITGYSNCNGTSDDIKTIKYCVNVPEVPDAINGPLTVCHGDAVTYAVTVDTSVESYTWILPSGWSGSSTTNTIDVVATSSGTLAVVANGISCPSAPTSLFVSVIGPPDMPGQITGDLTVCSGVEQAYSIVPVAGALAYEWNTPAGWIGTSTTINWSGTVGSQSGEISVVAINACGPSNAQSVFVDVTRTPGQPSIINGKDTICFGVPETYNIEQIPNAVYEWTLPGDWFTPDNFQSTINCIPGTSGIISVVASTGECVSPSRTIDVVVNLAPEPIQAIVGEVSICSNSSKLYFVDPPNSNYTYEWVLPAGWIGTSTTNSILVQAESSGTILAKAINSCGESNEVSLAVIVHSSAPATPVLISGDTSLCEGANTSFVLNNQDDSDLYHWQFPQGWSAGSESNVLDIVVESASGSIAVNAYNACGFSGTLNIPVSVTTIVSDITVSGNTLVAAQQGVSYQWIDCNSGEIVPEVTSSTFTPTVSGNYAVILTDEECMVTSECLRIIFSSTGEGILENQVLVFPNPFNSLLHVHSKETILQTEVYELNGTRIYTPVSQNADGLFLDLATIPPGTYVLYVLFPKGRFIEKIVKL